MEMIGAVHPAEKSESVVKQVSIFRTTNLDILGDLSDKPLKRINNPVAFWYFRIS
jgi:hypothetical protein